MQWNIASIILVLLYFANGAVINVEIENVRNSDGNFTDIIKPPMNDITDEIGVATKPPALQDTKKNFNLMSTLPPRIKAKEDSVSDMNFLLNPTRAAAFREKEDNIGTDTKPSAFCLKCLESHAAFRTKPTETPRFYGKPIHAPQYAQPAAPPYPQYPVGFPGYPGYPGFPGFPFFGGIPPNLNLNTNPNIATVVTPNGNFTIISGFNTGFPNIGGFPTIIG